eukprot:TRINITY_DN4414_c0_g1_i5.p1 TRINITY_DN4414_c0_g1~~TRINITY_DN4414_c0_g1_i5.p1  ORF type:complete len:828 (+),score=22.57 TRINITY_DN4414_c0_g1_i5:42-2525(+)
MDCVYALSIFVFAIRFKCSSIRNVNEECVVSAIDDGFPYFNSAPTDATLGYSSSAPYIPNAAGGATAYGTSATTPSYYSSYNPNAAGAATTYGASAASPPHNPYAAGAATTHGASAATSGYSSSPYNPNPAGGATTHGASAATSGYYSSSPYNPNPAGGATTHGASAATSGYYSSSPYNPNPAGGATTHGASAATSGYYSSSPYKPNPTGGATTHGTSATTPSYYSSYNPNAAGAATTYGASAATPGRSSPTYIPPVSAGVPAANASKPTLHGGGGTVLSTQPAKHGTGTAVYPSQPNTYGGGGGGTVLSTQPAKHGTGTAVYPSQPNTYGGGGTVLSTQPAKHGTGTAVYPSQPNTYGGGSTILSAQPARHGVAGATAPYASGDAPAAASGPFVFTEDPKKSPAFGAAGGSSVGALPRELLKATTIHPSSGSVDQRQPPLRATPGSGAARLPATYTIPDPGPGSTNTSGFTPGPSHLGDVVERRERERGSEARGRDGKHDQRQEKEDGGRGRHRPTSRGFDPSACLEDDPCRKNLERAIGNTIVNDGPEGNRKPRPAVASSRVNWSGKWKLVSLHKNEFISSQAEMYSNACKNVAHVVPDKGQEQKPTVFLDNSYVKGLRYSETLWKERFQNAQVDGKFHIEPPSFPKEIRGNGYWKITLGTLEYENNRNLKDIQFRTRDFVTALHDTFYENRKSPDANEVFLLHGVPNIEVAKSIVDNGFELPKRNDIKLAETNSFNRFGPGIYLTDALNKALHYAQADKEGIKYVIVSKVCLGADPLILHHKLRNDWFRETFFLDAKLIISSKGLACPRSACHLNEVDISGVSR